MEKNQSAARNPEPRKGPTLAMDALRAGLRNRDSLAVRRFLMGLQDEDSEDPATSETALHILAEAGDLPSMTTLIRRGAELHARDITGRTPMHLAAGNNQPEAISLLAQSGANLSAQSFDGSTPLHEAAARRAVQAIERLLRLRAPVNARSSVGDTPLHVVATTTGDVASATALVAAGADLQLADMHGDTPLHMAVEAGYEGIVRLLLRRYAPTAITNKLGLTPDAMPSMSDARDNKTCVALVATTRWSRQCLYFNSAVAANPGG